MIIAEDNHVGWDMARTTPATAEENGTPGCVPPPFELVPSH